MEPNENKKKRKFWGYLANYKVRLRITSAGLIVVLTILFLITLRLTFLVINRYHFADDADGKIRLEIIKSLLNILVVVIIGTAVTALFKSHERNLEESQLRVQTIIDFKNRLSKIYNRVKLSRRNLYAEGLRHKDNIVSGNFNAEQIELYKQEMKKINLIQLELEGMAELREKTDRQAASHLTLMEQYLNKILDEFKRLNLDLKNPDNVPLGDFPRLIEFTSSPKVNEIHFKERNQTVDIRTWDRFKKNFSYP